MDVDLDLEGRGVIVVGPPDVSRRVISRYERAGASVAVVPASDAAALLECASRDQGFASGPAVLPDLIVWIEGDRALRRKVEEACRNKRLWFVAEVGVGPTPRGHVTLVGGGPGEPGLMTIAARRALLDADVVLYDRLGPVDELAAWAPGATLIDVGKTPGHHAVPQREIEAILVEHALQGLRVVRLKGGDSFVFGRGGEEVIACRIAGIPVTVVPGVTSAISVPSAAGIPVTHREVSRAFTVISGHVPLGEDELSHLVGLGGTLVVLMGVGTLPHLVAGLQRHGLRRDMPLALIERGYRMDQRTTTTTVAAVTGLLGTVAPRSPAVIVIGDVVSVPDWAEEAARSGVAPWDDTRHISGSTVDAAQ